MKNKFKYSLLLGATLLLAGLLSSCINDKCLIDNPDNRGAAAFIRIIDSNDKYETRSAHSPSIGNVPVKFHDGWLFLVNDAGIIRQRFEIIDNALVALNTTDREICRTALRDTGVTIPAVPRDVRHVYIVGNYGGTVAFPDVGGNIANVLNRQLGITSQHDVENVNLFGTRELQQRQTGTLYYNGYRIWETHNSGTPAPVVLAPTVARFEIGGIRGAYDIYTFNVAGIFINNFHRTARIDGDAITPTAVIDNFDTSILANFTNTAAGYAFDTNNAVRRWLPAALPGTHGSVVSPPSGNVWGFQVFAASGTMPSIVVRLENVRLRGSTGTNRGDRLVVVNNVAELFDPFPSPPPPNELRPPSMVVTHIEPGRVYRIGLIEFGSAELVPAIP